MPTALHNPPTNWEPPANVALAAISHAAMGDYRDHAELDPTLGIHRLTIDIGLMDAPEQVRRHTLCMVADLLSLDVLVRP